MSGIVINFAKLYGIKSVALAVVFAILYVPFFGWFVLQSIRRPTYVFIILAFFCSVRIAAFALRAAMAGVESAGQNLGLLIADQVLMGVGFFGLLYSAYTLVLDRQLMTGVEPYSPYTLVPGQHSNDAEPRRGLIRRLIMLTGNRMLFRLALMVAVALGITGASETSMTNPSGGSSLRQISTYVFLALTVILAIRTILLVRTELILHENPNGKSRGYKDDKRASLVLSLICLFLLVREIFATATIKDLTKQNNEHYWYPLYALPEILAVALYATPDLVPPRSELPK